MSIQVRCPQCEKAYKLADDKKGKQVRCPACSQLFRAEPAAKAEPASEAVASAPRKAAGSPKTKPAASAPASSKKWPVLLIGAIIAVPLLVCGGGVAAILAGVWYLYGAAATTVSSLDQARPTVAVGGSQVNPGSPPPPQTRTPAPPPNTGAPPQPVRTPNWDTFAKIDKGMTQDDVVALMGQPAAIQNNPANSPGVDQRMVFNGEANFKFTVELSQGKVVKKINNGNRPNFYPSDTAQNTPSGKKTQSGSLARDRPPSDKPPPTPKVPLTQELFDKIDRGMTVDQLVALAGKPNGDDDMTRFNNPDVDRRLSWDDYVADIAIRVDMVKGKVVSKQGSSRGTHWAVVYPSGPAPAPAKPVGTLTRASFDKIDKGMSTDDVIALFGQPSATVGLDPTKFGVDTQMEFVSIGGHGGVAATVYLLQGKVVKKTNPQNWPIAYPSERGK